MANEKKTTKKTKSKATHGAEAAPVFRSREERIAAGRLLRDSVPRASHAAWNIPAKKHRDPIAILEKSNKDRLQELVPIRYGRMLRSPFTFLRGSAALMAYDLATTPSTGIRVQACGDCHLMNFGAFSTPEENIMFNVNDFDETLPGVDFTFDVKRLAASVAVAADAAQISKKLARALAAGTVEAYRKQMLVLAGRSPLEAWNSHINLEQEMKQIGDPGLQRSLRRMIARALRAKSSSAIVSGRSGLPPIEVWSADRSG